MKQEWQSKLVLLVVLPAAATDVALRTQWWAAQAAPVAGWTLGLSLLLGLVTWKLRAATPAAAAAGALITASLMGSTAVFPYQPWHTALVPVLAVSLLTFAVTRLGREKKQRLGDSGERNGRSAAQISANLGLAALLSSGFFQSSLVDSRWFALAPDALFVAALAALAEAAADTAASELGQLFSTHPRLLTSLRVVAPGTDGAISLPGTAAGVLAAVAVAAAGAYALCGGAPMFALSCAGGVFGLFFDSLLGATLERRGWLNNDAVNFLSTASAAAFALTAVAFLR
jgi:uncharacterized protein (TIGR00297 family)